MKLERSDFEESIAIQFSNLVLKVKGMPPSCTPTLHSCSTVIVEALNGYQAINLRSGVRMNDER